MPATTTQYATIVVGAGLIGSAVARHLTAEGSVLLLEQFPLLHERGSSHGGSRIFRHAYADELHTRLAVRANTLWTELEAETGERLLFRTGGIDVFGEDDPGAAQMLGSLRASGSSAEEWSGTELARRYPCFAPRDEKRVVYHPAAAVLPASRAVATLLRSATTRGALIREQQPVTRVAPHAHGVAVTAGSGTFTARRLVVAAGAWLGRLAADLHLPLVVEQQQVIYLPIRNDTPGHTVGRMPVFIERLPDGDGGIYGLPAFEYPHAIKVADNGGARPIPDAETRDFQPDTVLAARTVHAATALLPQVGSVPVDTSTCLYTRTPDGRFVIDRHPDYPHVVLVGGGSGHAFKFGPVFGELVAELFEGEPAHPEFGIGRFKRVG